MPVADRPIIFSADSVRAILDGRKTQTRRLVKHQVNGKLIPLDPGTRLLPREDWGLRDPGSRYHLFHRPVLESEADGRGVLPSGNFGLPCPHGEPGDRLWVKETWSHDCASLDDARAVEEDLMSPSRLYYRAEPAHEGSGLRWRSPLHMPRWASRLTLEVLSVRVERVQYITEEDALAEGVPEDDDRPLPGFPCPKCGGDGTIMTGYPPDYGATWIDCGACDTATKRFSLMWGAINGRRAPWASNPWVWVLEFRRV